jgi:hypothetical protein
MITQETDIAAAYREAELRGYNQQTILDVLTLAVEQDVLDTLETWQAAEELAASTPANLRSRFHFDADADQRAPELVSDCLTGLKDQPPSFDEWFRMAYALQLVTGCTVESGRVGVIREGRSFVWEEVVAKLSLEHLRKLYELARTQATLEQREASVEKAEEFVHLPIVDEKLCAAWKTATDDVFELATIAVPTLIPLAIADTITIRLTPVLIAGCATFVARMSVASFCPEQE